MDFDKLIDLLYESKVSTEEIAKALEARKAADDKQSKINEARADVVIALLDYMEQLGYEGDLEKMGARIEKTLREGEVYFNKYRKLYFAF